MKSGHQTCLAQRISTASHRPFALVHSGTGLWLSRLALAQAAALPERLLILRAMAMSRFVSPPASCEVSESVTRL